jgi:hypothetical protein
MNKPSSAKYFFLELGIIASLYVFVVSFISFAFEIINYIFPDRLAYGFDPYASSLRFSIATIVVAFPVFVVLSRMMLKMLLTDTESRMLAVRRWLSYFTVFVAVAVIAGDLIAVINTFLSGEITVRFFAKVAVVLIVAVGVLMYFLKDLKGLFYEKPKLFQNIMIGVSVVVLASLIGGFMVIGLPASQRDLRDDQTRSANLSTMQWDVVSYYQRTGNLPANTDQLIDPLYPQQADNYKDPATEKPYEYRSVAGKDIAFELCADFALASRTKDDEGRGSYPEGSGFSPKYASVDFYPGSGELFEHTEGRNCFTRIIDPARHPVQKPGDGMVRPL